MRLGKAIWSRRAGFKSQPMHRRSRHQGQWFAGGPGGVPGLVKGRQGVATLATRQVKNAVLFVARRDG